jgi:hypothetical protein
LSPQNLIIFIQWWAQALLPEQVRLIVLTVRSKIGIIFAVLAILRFGEDTNYEREECVVPLLTFEAKSAEFPPHTDVSSSEENRRLLAQ